MTEPAVIALVPPPALPTFVYRAPFALPASQYVCSCGTVFLLGGGADRGTAFVAHMIATGHRCAVPMPQRAS